MSKPEIKPVIYSLFPIRQSLREVADIAEAKLPITSSAQLYTILMTYHNTLVSKLAHDEVDASNALRTIQSKLNGLEWDSGTLCDIAEILSSAGYELIEG